MGHRALLAYRRDDCSNGADSNLPESADFTLSESTDPNPSKSTDSNPPKPTTNSHARYDLHRSHWGGADFALLDHISADTPYATDTSFAVDPDPVATDCSLADAATNHLDFLQHEAFYRVDSGYDVTAYHVLWFGLEADAQTVERSETVGHGALVEAHSDDSNYLRGWFRGAKEVVGEMVDRDALAPAEATSILAERVQLWADDRDVFVPD